MGQRDRILQVDDRVVELVDVPEWGEKVRVKSLTIAEQKDFREAVRLRTGKNEDEYRVNNDKFTSQLLIRTCINEDGTPLFEQADADELMHKSGAAVGRLVECAVRLAGIGDEQLEETVDELKETASDG